MRWASIAFATPRGGLRTVKHKRKSCRDTVGGTSSAPMQPGKCSKAERRQQLLLPCWNSPRWTWRAPGIAILSTRRSSNFVANTRNWTSFWSRVAADSLCKVGAKGSVMSAYCIGSYDIADFVLAQCLPRRDHENPHPREK